MNWRPNIKNRTFDWMGEGYRPLIDPNHFLGHNSFDFPRHNVPPANMARHEKKLVLEVSVPGFTKGDLEVSVKGDVLTIKGHRPNHAEESGAAYVLEEFSTNSFERQFKISSDISIENMEAKCENGVLCISFFDEEGKADKKVHKIAVD